MEGCLSGVPTGTNTRGTSPQGHFCIEPTQTIVKPLSVKLRNKRKAAATTAMTNVTARKRATIQRRRKST